MFTATLPPWEGCAGVISLISLLVLASWVLAGWVLEPAALVGAVMLPALEAGLEEAVPAACMPHSSIRGL